MTERREFGNLAGPLIITLACIMVYIATCFILAIDNTNKKREEYLKYYTPRGERLTFAPEPPEDSRYYHKLKKK